MTDQEKTIASSMLAKIENAAECHQQSAELQNYREFLRACLDRRELDSPRPALTATEIAR